MARSWVKLFTQDIDRGFIGALGVVPYIVYKAIERYAWRGVNSGSSKVEELRAKGKIAARVNQTTIAIRLGLSRSTVNKALKIIQKVGFLKAVRIEGHGRGYVIGFVSSKSGKEILYSQQRLKEIFREVAQVRWRRKHEDERRRVQMIRQILGLEGRSTPNSHRGDSR